MCRVRAGFAIAALVALLATTAGTKAEVDLIEGNPLIEVPAGSFIFGNDSGPENERPQSVETLSAFAMNRTEITNAQYRRFATGTGHEPTFYSSHPVLGLDEHPAVGVSWADADDFCRHYGLSLPSEREFERASRGTDGAPFPWGDTPADATRVSGGSDACCAEDERDGFPITAPVDSFENGASAEGIVDLIGNVWEWTRDVYAPYRGEADAEIAGKFKVLRGGAWNSDPEKLSATCRLAFDPDFRFAANGGFRCVRSAPQS